MKLASIVLVGLAGVLMIAFNNCSQVALQKIDTSATEQGTPVPPVEIAKKCQGAQLSKVISVDFPAPSQMCAWGVGGNLQVRDSYFQARTEQDVDFVLPVGASICDIDFQFQRQAFYYDDHIILSLNDRILASSYDWQKILSKDANGLEIYDWDRIAGKDWESGSSLEGVFCAGKSEGLASCDWPQTQVEGNISMDFDQSIIQKVMAASVGRDKHVLKFITTGDNDTNNDCWHKAISFQINVKYVP